MEGTVRFVWLEELRAGLGTKAKLQRPAGCAPPRAPAGHGHPARQPGGGAVHVRVGGCAQGGGAEPPQHPGQHRAGRLRAGFQPGGPGAERHADVPLHWPEQRHAAAAAVGRADVPVPVAAALPDGAGADLWHGRHHHVRQRHVPARLGEVCPPVRLPRHALRGGRGGEGARRDAADLCGQVRRAHPGRLRRYRNRARSGADHPHEQPRGHGGPLAAGHRMAVAAGARHRARRRAAGARPQRDAGLRARHRAGRAGAASRTAGTTQATSWTWTSAGS